MSDKIGLFTGSFDPITKGHVDLIERASRLFDKLYVGVFYNREKSGFFRIEARERMVKEALQHLDNVEVITSQNELAVTVARRLGAQVFVRGLRNSQDLDYEADMNFFNRELAGELETIFLLSKPAYQPISSSRIRELIAFQQDIADYVPQSVIKELERRTYEKN
ncbi:pantetheine-phosphate adenylyltransferase [Streptococcus gordonii]|uniref:pantetheine-phosphate adenylyltransferase n=1 Tax=Streptococcus gordonii TaxID=1302 RepID=UPI00073B6723|nr:pantetheine-phosphate adenylyltransferase [Streptococcus gordonii]KTF20276.1 phosphopantetheine adenylyltransferase [Streptococcus gordonii]KXC03990.1 phosphopantetheine adenylyltransferase [Streptococcus gordonii]MBZ2150475.1 pantetheine-phosphate adenylyltransferase [Streptococcus gordonii]QWZ57902.1 pantetheine-phosphate adenylyltransferase [Streptococcus gordonii]SQF29721.1 phosphopantetheine adenylyltransferase [Streptococcus gordonii]